MKKFLAMLCMLTCIFGLTACGEEAEISSFDEFNSEKAKEVTMQAVLPYMCLFENGEVADEFLAEYDKYEMEYIAELMFDQQHTAVKHDVEGSAVISAITSFNSAFEAIGGAVEFGEPVVEVAGDELIVTVPVTGTSKTATAEFIYSNDLFLTLESAALNPEATFGDLMTKAALNTLMGMGTVFAVLILISLIISAMGVIPKLQDKMKKKAEKKAEKKDMQTEAVDNTIAQIIEKEELSDDLELVAVIAAAIAASEGATSTDGFVVRSIRRARR